MEEIPTFLLFSLSLLSAAPSSPTILSNAADTTLMDSGYLSMVLTLRLASSNLRFDSPTATIFVPSDLALFHSGQLPLSLLRCHISPARVSVQDLVNLSHGGCIPTLLPNFSLTLTRRPNSHSQFLINNVNVGNTAIFDHGSVIMLRIDEFFNSSSLVVPESVQSPKPRSGSGNGPFGSVSDLLRSRGRLIMRTFLDAQLAELTDGTRLTFFAPADIAVGESVRNASDYSAVFVSILFRDCCHAGVVSH